ncbi:MAG: biopolymer transporter ExbD [Proteobacteria bacterium]|nr:biopolymer transporter ExbD [Pseudomonadota bacterium]
MSRNKSAIGGEEEEATIDLTPMLDVVFIMLIFFIVTASFIKESGIDVNRPTAYTAEKQADAAILVAISAIDEIWIDRNVVPVANVRSIIQKLHLENPKGSLVIQADENSTNELLIIVMEAAKHAGVVNVAISTLDE